MTSAGEEWKNIFQEAVKLAEQYTATLGCRSLDILHCAAAKVLAATEFVSPDGRQKKLAAAMGLKLERLLLTPDVPLPGGHVIEDSSPSGNRGAFLRAALRPKVLRQNRVMLSYGAPSVTRKLSTTKVLSL